MKRNQKLFIRVAQNKTRNSIKGFTLIELLVVITVVSLLTISLLAILNPFAQIQKANDTRRKADLSQIQKALESYYQDNGSYPAEGAGNTISGVAWGTNWGVYMNVLPKDPNLSNKYIYVRPDGQKYYLYANLERGSKDPQVCNGGAKCANAPVTTCGGVCNYGVSSADVSP